MYEGMTNEDLLREAEGLSEDLRFIDATGGRDNPERYMIIVQIKEIDAEIERRRKEAC